MRKMKHELQVLETLSHRMELDQKGVERYQFLKWEDYTKKDFDAKCSLALGENVSQVNDLRIAYDDIKEPKVALEKYILIGHHGYLIEMRNGCNEYEETSGKWQGDPTFISKMDFKKMQNTRLTLQKIYREAMIKIDIELVIVILAEQEITMAEDLPGTVVRYAAIDSWLAALKKEQVTVLPITQPTTYAMDWARELNLYASQPQLSGIGLKLSDKHLLKTGICCDECHHIDMSEVSVGAETAFICNHCGAMEPIEIAYCRTICEWGTIFNDYDLLPEELEEFFGKNLRRDYLDSVLKRHFTPIEPWEYLQDPSFEGKINL